CLVFYLFFVTSRRRHRRLVSDVSSDLCSSDLCRSAAFCGTARVLARPATRQAGQEPAKYRKTQRIGTVGRAGHTPTGQPGAPSQIGRAACRERGQKWVDELRLTEKDTQCRGRN